MIEELPQYLKVFIKTNQYELIDILQYNARKYVYVLKVKKDSQYFILKAFDENNTPIDIQAKLKTELKFYSDNVNMNVIPDLTEAKNNIMILEYIESISLREYLITNKTDNIISNLLDSIKVFQNLLVYDKYCENNNFDNIYRYIGSLANSHPIQAKDIYIDKVDSVLNRIITKLLNIKVNNLLTNFSDENLRKCFSHMDFHYNNILVDKSLHIKFIDFENIQYQGYFEFDILFLIILVEVYVDKSSNEFDNLQNFKKELFKKNIILGKVYKLYKIAISVNNKFYISSKKKSLNKFQKISLIIKLLAKIC